MRRLNGSIPNGSLGENSGWLANNGVKGRDIISVEEWDVLEAGEDIEMSDKRWAVGVRTVELGLGLSARELFNLFILVTHHGHSSQNGPSPRATLSF